MRATLWHVSGWGGAYLMMFSRRSFRLSARSSSAVGRKRLTWSLYRWVGGWVNELCIFMGR